MDLWNNIIYANRETEFVSHLKHFETVCVVIFFIFKYVSETWLISYKERFVATWVNRVTHLGNTTTNKYTNVILMLLHY